MTAAACPRCGSADPAVRLPVAYRVFICNDPWHDRPTDRCTTCGSTDPAVRNIVWSEGGAHPVRLCRGDWHDRPTGADPVLAVTGRRIGATGIHLRPDGSECNYSVGPDSLICMKCGWPGIAEAPTGADDLAARLEEAARIAADVWGLAPGDAAPVVEVLGESVTLSSSDLLAAAARIRELEAGIADAVRELDGVHYQDPLVRTLCVVCGAADGSWPCTSRLEADDLRKLAEWDEATR